MSGVKEERSISLLLRLDLEFSESTPKTLINSLHATARNFDTPSYWTLTKKFVRYREGAEKYSIGLTKFQELSKEAGAVYKIDGIALVNCEIFEKFLESFREY